MKKEENRVRCSFCGKAEGEVKLLISGIDAYICSDCVELCWNVLQAGTEKENDKPDGKKSKG